MSPCGSEVLSGKNSDVASSSRWIFYFTAVMRNRLEVNGCFKSAAVFGNGTHTHLSHKGAPWLENTFCPFAKCDR